MSKDIKETVEEPKKKMVVVEEVEIETPKVEEEKVNVVNSELVEKTNYLWIIIPTALLVGILVGGLITYFSGISKLKEVSATPTPVISLAPEATTTPAPTPKVEIDRSEIKLQVLNGSGISGLAGKAKAYLEGLGYKNIAVGNASVSNMTETTVANKDIKKDLLDSVITDLSKSYKVSEKTEVLPTSSKYDFVITLGSKQSLTR